MNIICRAMFMLAITGLHAADAGPASTAHIRVGASISRFLSISGEPLLRFRELRPGSRVLQAWTDLKLGAGSAGCTVLAPSSILLQGAAGGPALSVAVQLTQEAGAKAFGARLELPGGAPNGAYAGVMDVVVVYN